MASKIKGINIKIGADYVGIDKALSDITSKSKKTQSELREITKAMKNAPDSLVLWKQKQEALTKAIDDSRKKVDFLENAQEQVAKQLAEGKISPEQYRAFQRELEEARAESERLKNQLQDTQRKIEDFGKDAKDTASDTDKLNDSLEDSEQAAENAGDGYTVLKDVLANLATQGINFALGHLKEFTQQVVETGKEFELSMSNVQAISGATNDEMQALSDKAKQMGATTKYTAAQTADAFGYMALAGWKTEDMLSGIDGVLNLAAASGMDLAQASDIVTDYLTAFGLGAENSAKFVDQMTFAMANSNTTTELLGEAYKNCAATSASMGYSVEETTAVLMTMANAGVKGGEAGTALNAIMTRLATDTKNCASELAEYGVHVYDSKGNMQTLSSILQGVSDVWQDLTDQEQANLAKMIAGTNHYSALQTIMNGLTETAEASGMGFSAYAEALAECDGTAQNMSETMLDNLAGDMTILESGVDGVRIALAEKFNPILRDIVQYITDKMPEIQSSAEKLLDNGIDFADWVKKNLPEIKGFFEKATPAISAVASGIAGLVVANTASKAIGGLKSAFSVLNAAMLANPATAVTVAIAALATAIGVYCVQAETELSDVQKIYDEVDEKYAESDRQIQEISESIGKIYGNFDKNAESIRKEGDRITDLKKKLDNLCDSSGKVRESDRLRAEYILGELNSALGTEYELTGNQIKGYQNLQNEIDKTIEKKKAEAYIDALNAEASEMAENRANSRKQYVEAGQKRDSAKNAMDEAYNALKQLAPNTELTPESINNIANMSEGQRAVLQYSDEAYNAAKAYISAQREYVNATSEVAQIKANYDEISDYYNRYEQAYNAFAEGNYSEVEKIVFDSKSKADYILENADDWDEELKNAYDEKSTELAYTLELVLNTDIVNQSEVDDIFTEIADLVVKGLRSGAESSEIITDEIQELLKKSVEKGLDLSALVGDLKDTGLDIGELFKGMDISKILQEQSENGYDTADLLEWGAKSGLWDKTFEKVSLENVQNMLDEGLDPTEFILKMSEVSQKASNSFSENYMKIAQEMLDEGVDPTEFIGKIAGANKKASESFSKNYMKIAQGMIDEGLDPTEMLLKMTESDKTMASDFDENCYKVIEAMLNSGMDTSGLFSWWNATTDKVAFVWDEKVRKKIQAGFGVDSGEPSFFEWGHDIQSSGVNYDQLLGENFEQYYADYLYYLDAKNGNVKNNSAWDAELDRERRRRVGLLKYATGGYISAGNSGIVAEAGTELIQAMNGGLKITPIQSDSSGAGGTSGAGQKIFYNSYNINNPKIASDMDIRTIAQKLAHEQRRIERGHGL